MKTIVRKYGGSSVSSVPKIKRIAEQIKPLYQEGNKIVIVVSAMGKTTDELLQAAQEITDVPDKRELDMLLSIGERKSISLMALALNAIGIPTVSYTGSQAGVITDNDHGNACILELRGSRIEQAIKQNKVVVVAGYQGVSLNKEITTLGRGGTDTTAVAIAAWINADRCELMKDVDGLYALPPHLFKSQSVRTKISYEEFLEIAEAGAELLAKDAIQIAKKKQIVLGLGNTETGNIGTLISDYSMDIQGISQVIERQCKTMDVYTASNDTLAIGLHYFDLHPDTKEKDVILITLLGVRISTNEILALLKHFFSDELLYISSSKIIIAVKEPVFLEIKSEFYRKLNAFM